MIYPLEYHSLNWQAKRLIREAYAEEQGGKCYYCEQSLEQDPPFNAENKPINWRAFPPNFLQYPVHLQHNHDTGLTEGAVHAYCNAVLWQYEGK